MIIRVVFTFQKLSIVVAVCGDIKQYVHWCVKLQPNTHVILLRSHMHMCVEILCAIAVSVCVASNGGV